MTRFLLVVAALILSPAVQAQFVDATLLAHYTTTEVDSIFQSAGIFPTVTPINYEVEIYAIEYQTDDPQNNPTTATGAVAIPVNKRCSPMMCYNHGTIAEKDNVPSYLSDESLIGVVAATDGYIVVMPDYLGLGDGPGFHPYVHARSQATATVDMIRATREFCMGEGFGYSNQIFLTGYSQGGHACMATHQLIHEEFPWEFDVEASAPMAGPYDMDGVMVDIMTGPNAYSDPGYLPYVIMGYQEAYGTLYNDLSEIIRPPYDSISEALLDGTHSMGSLNSLLPSVPRDMLDSTFLDAFVNDSQHPVRQLLTENVTYDWMPTDSMRIYYCSGDQTIPFANAIAAYDAFMANGSQVVSHIDISPTLNHGPCAAIALLVGKLWFDELVDEECVPVGAEELPQEAPGLEVFPNPAAEVVTVQLDQLNGTATSLRISDLAGNVLQTTVVSSTAQTVDISGLASGVYVVEAAPQGIRKKLIIAR